MARKKFFTEEERKAATLARQKARVARRRASRLHLAPEGDLRRKYATPEERDEAARRNALKRSRKRKAREKAERRAALEETKAAARRFRREVPAILNSPLRTRLFIALCERGPYTIKDVGLAIAQIAQPARRTAVHLLIAMGIVARHQATKGSNPVYYLNPGHPAHRELLRFGRRLAERWPSPPRPVRTIAERAVPLPSSVPCVLFRGVEEVNRVLLLIAVTGGMYAMQIYERGGMLSGPRSVADSLRFFISAGMVFREPLGVARGQGGPRPYRLDPRFFAHKELRDVLWALAATVHDDIAGYAEALAQRYPEMQEHVAEFKRGTAHLRNW